MIIMVMMMIIDAFDAFDWNKSGTISYKSLQVNNYDDEVDATDFICDDCDDCYDNDTDGDEDGDDYIIGDDHDDGTRAAPFQTNLSK